MQKRGAPEVVEWQAGTYLPQRKYSPEELDAMCVPNADHVLGSIVASFLNGQRPHIRHGQNGSPEELAKAREEGAHKLIAHAALESLTANALSHPPLVRAFLEWRHAHLPGVMTAGDDTWHDGADAGLVFALRPPQDSDKAVTRMFDRVANDAFESVARGMPSAAASARQVESYTRQFEDELKVRKLPASWPDGYQVRCRTCRRGCNVVLPSNAISGPRP